MKHILKLTLLASFLVSACSTSTGESQLPIAERTINVVTTTGMIADIVLNLGGERVNVEALMGPGVDPHLYKPTASDVTKLERADIVFYNGLHLEDAWQKSSKRWKKQDLQRTL